MSGRSPARRCRHRGHQHRTGIDLDEFNQISGGFKYLAGGPFREAQDIIVDQFYAEPEQA